MKKLNEAGNIALWILVLVGFMGVAMYLTRYQWMPSDEPKPHISGATTEQTPPAHVSGKSSPVPQASAEKPHISGAD